MTNGTDIGGIAPKVVIVGAGPAGAALSFIMARRGIPVLLLERQTDFAREFRGEALMPTGVDAMRQIGLGAQLDGLPHVILKGVDLYIGRRGPYRILAPGAEKDLGIRMVSQPLMLEMIIDEAGSFPTFHFERGATVRDLIEESRRVVGVKYDYPGGVREVRADMIIGTDGRASVIRKRAGLHQERFPQFFDVVWGKVPLPAFMRGRAAARAYLGNGNAALCFPTGDGKLQIGWIIEKGSFGELREQGIQNWFIRLARTLLSDELGNHVLGNLEAISHPFLLDVICDRLVNWTKPGLLLLGDAAHPMSPVGGQGINMALRDALVAANHLVPALTGNAAHEESDRAAIAVQQERLPEIEAIQKLQQAQPPVLFGTNLFYRIARAALIPLLAHPAFAPRVFDSVRQRFANGITEVRLSAGL